MKVKDKVQIRFNSTAPEVFQGKTGTIIRSGSVLYPFSVRLDEPVPGISWMDMPFSAGELEPYQDKVTEEPNLVTESEMVLVEKAMKANPKNFGNVRLIRRLIATVRYLSQNRV